MTEHRLVGIHAVSPMRSSGGPQHRRAYAVIEAHRTGYWECSLDGVRWSQCPGHQPPEPREVDLVPMAGCGRHPVERMRIYSGSHVCLSCASERRARKAAG